MGEDLYACAVCEESFPIAKSLVNHVNDCHVSVQSSVEPKKVVKSMQTSIEHQKENNSKVAKTLPSSINHQKGNDTKVVKIKLKKEETNERKNNQQKSFIPIANPVSEQSSVELKMENYNKEVERQMENDTNVDAIKSQKETTQGRKNNQKKYSINIDSKIVKIKENDSKDFISLPSSIEYQKENKVATIKSEKKGMKGRKNKQQKRFIDIYSKIVTSFNEHQKKNDSKEFISLPSSIECQNENDTKVDTIKLEKEIKERKNYHQFYKNSGRFMCKFCNQIATSKGQLISKCSFDVIVWTRIPTKFFPRFLP